jgi:hypothetical protein
MSKTTPELLKKGFGTGGVVQSMLALFRFFVAPSTQDLEQTLSFEFFYQRKAAFGRGGRTENILKAKMGRQDSNDR